MNTALDLTLEVLANTPNVAADQMLSLAITESPLLRRRGIKALLSRRNKFGAQRVLQIWDELTDDELRAVQEFPLVMQPVVEETLRGRVGSPEWFSALDALRMLSLAGLLPMVIDLLEASSDDDLRNRMLTTVLEIGSSLGDAARQGRDQVSVRAPVVNRLADSVRQVNYHRCEKLCDAFLAASVWGDRELRLLLQEDYSSARRLAGVLESSSLPGVVQLIAGYVRRRSIPEVVRNAIETRKDDPFREQLLAAIGDQPSRISLKNLSGFKALACLNDWQSLVAKTKSSNYSGLLYAHTHNSNNVVAQLSVILDVVARGQRSTDLAIVSSLGRCQKISDDEWLQAAFCVTNSDVAAAVENPVAALLWRMVQLLDHPDPAVVDALREVLKPLHVDSLLRNIDQVPVASFQRLGGMVRKIDPRTVEILSDELRCPVMDRRMRAIRVAKACDVVGEVEKLLTHAAVHDHRETRLIAIETLEYGTTEESLDVLQRIASGPVGALRDAALHAIENRRKEIFTAMA